MPDTTPMRSDHHSFAASQLPVIPTSPDSSPFDSDDTLSIFSKYKIKKYTVRDPADPDNVVFIQTLDKNPLSYWSIILPSPCFVQLLTNSAEPPLNPYQPNQRINAPSVTIPTLCGLNSSSVDSSVFSNLPILGPRMIAPINPQVAPCKCTIPEPAKSLYPNSANHPFSAHVQCTTMG